jgi:hypothetical protein
MTRWGRARVDTYNLSEYHPKNGRRHFCRYRRTRNDRLRLSLSGKDAVKIGWTRSPKERLPSLKIDARSSQDGQADFGCVCYFLRRQRRYVRWTHDRRECGISPLDAERGVFKTKLGKGGGFLRPTVVRQ